MKFVSLILLSAAAFAAEPKVVPVWPGAAPGSESWKYEEKEVPGQDGAARISNVTRPTLTVFLPEASKATGTAVIICPGGGFRFLSFTHERTELAPWRSPIGVAAIVLKSRLVRTGEQERKRATRMWYRTRTVC